MKTKKKKKLLTTTTTITEMYNFFLPEIENAYTKEMQTEITSTLYS